MGKRLTIDHAGRFGDEFSLVIVSAVQDRVFHVL